MRRIVRHKVKRIKPDPKYTSARHFKVFPDPRGSHLWVDVYVFRTRAQMHARVNWWDKTEHEPWMMGLCRTWTRTRYMRGQGVSRAGCIARIFYNIADLRRQPSEITSHECAHAAMGWARYKRAHLGRMAGEEVMCYALGKIVAQVNHNLHAMGAFV